MKVYNIHRLFCIFLGFCIFYLSCSKDNKPKEEVRPFLNIEKGTFDVDVIIQQPGETTGNSSGTPLGSGKLSFKYSGDIEGDYSVSGSLVVNQQEKQGVGAVLSLMEDLIFPDQINEALSILAFYPRGDGKADIFLLGNKTDFPVSSIEPGDVFGIGPLDPFNGLFLEGLDINEFWAGEANFLETAEKAFVMTAGFVEIVARDSSHIVGNFAGTTDPDRNVFNKYIP
ncbi:MAG: hypothetical protein D6813_12635 [Calditrichaeota bacterium]|nr:MAG: hypothetical protein D6813_12635 [Calditrichota bacterium]